MGGEASKRIAINANLSILDRGGTAYTVGSKRLVGYAARRNTMGRLVYYSAAERRGTVQAVDPGFERHRLRGVSVLGGGVSAVARAGGGEVVVGDGLNVGVVDGRPTASGGKGKRRMVDRIRRHRTGGRRARHPNGTNLAGGTRSSSGVLLLHVRAGVRLRLLTDGLAHARENRTDLVELGLEGGVDHLETPREEGGQLQDDAVKLVVTHLAVHNHT